MDGTLVKITQREVDVQRDLVLARSELYLIKDSLVKAVESCRGGVLDADAARKSAKNLRSKLPISAMYQANSLSVIRGWEKS